MSVVIENTSKGLFMPEYAREFVAAGKTLLDFDFTQEAEKLLLYFQEIVARLDPEILQKMTVDLSSNGRPDHGFFRRSDYEGERTGDQKNIFHFRPYDTEVDLFKIYRERGVVLPEDFVWWFMEMKHLMTRTLIEVAEFLDVVDITGCLSARMKDPRVRSQHVIRLLDYDARPVLDELADEHCDFSFVTVPVLQTHPGLWTRPEKGNTTMKQFYNAVSGQTLVFAGRKMPTETGDLIPSVNHGVLSLPSIYCNEASSSRRGSFIIFLHTPGEMGPSCPS